jgi:RHS repeat-associated protein
LTTKRFTGQYHESSLPGGEGLSYYNARWYDAKLGRFLSADTIVPGPANPQAFKRHQPDKLFMQFRCRSQPI